MPTSIAVRTHCHDVAYQSPAARCQGAPALRSQDRANHDPLSRERVGAVADRCRRRTPLYGRTHGCGNRRAASPEVHDRGPCGGRAGGARVSEHDGGAMPSRRGRAVSVEPRPYTLIAELTYRCPLRCVYCSNPLELERHRRELDTETWLRVFAEAEDLGVVQLSLTGGEPCLREDLLELVEGARGLDLYTNLATAGVPLSRERLRELRGAGLDNVQISIQDVSAAASDAIAGHRSFERKLEVARAVKELGFPLTLNVVLHRQNLDRIAEVIALAE